MNYLLLDRKLVWSKWQFLFFLSFLNNKQFLKETMELIWCLRFLSLFYMLPFMMIVFVFFLDLHSLYLLHYYRYQNLNLKGTKRLICYKQVVQKETWTIFLRDCLAYVSKSLVCTFTSNTNSSVLSSHRINACIVYT